VLRQASGLSAGELESIADLERRVVDHDGGRLKLEWSTLRGRDSGAVNDLLWEDPANHGAARIVGFVGIYDFGGPDIELGGMVDPAQRRRGIGSALLAAALPIARERGYPRALLVTPRATSAGERFAHRHGAVLDHSEHFMVLTGRPQQPASAAAVTLRAVGSAERAPVARILSDAFGVSHDDRVIGEDSDSERALVIERAGAVAGTIRLTFDGEVGSIYGLAVDPALQGQGIGRAALSDACRDLHGRGAARITLEVATDNDRALGLYESVGFERRATDDYFAVNSAGL
jgi:ribosomal protein S18 acetylase RimI-like enzyme